MYYKSEKNTIAYQLTEPSTTVMVAHYKSDISCTVSFCYELNESAVAIVKRDCIPATKEEFDSKCKSSLKDIVSLCKKQGIQVPGIDEMNAHFNPKTNH